MKSKSNQILQTGLQTLGICILAFLPLAVPADIPPPPSRLHRIGFEIFKKDIPRKSETSNPVSETPEGNTSLTAAEEKELQGEISQLKALLMGKTEIELGDGKVVTFEEMVRDLRKNFRKIKQMAAQAAKGDPLPDDAWKYPQQVTAAERVVFRTKIDAVKAELQKLFDVEYGRMDAAGELRQIGLFKGEYEYRYQRTKREMATENALTVVKCVLEKNEKLRIRCEEVPIEWLAEAMKCPEPSIDDELIKAEFATWSFMRMPNGLIDSERKVIFAWQLFVAEKEKRPWRKHVLSASSSSERNRARVRRSRRFTDGYDGLGADRSKSAATESGFEDFAKSELSAADFVEFWYGKAVVAGMKPSAADQELLEKARASKNPWAGNANISLSAGVPRRIKIRGTVSMDELRKAHFSFVNGLGMDARTGFNLELDEFNSAFLKIVSTVFGDDRIDQLSLTADNSVGLDLALLADFKQVRILVLCNCEIGNGALLSGWKRFERMEAKNCTLGDMAFLSGCAGIREIRLDGCAFSGLGSLWASEWLRTLSVPNSRRTVDLAVVRKLEHLVELDITGCSVTNFTALKAHPSLNTLKMMNNKGGIDSLAFLAENSKLHNLEYSKKDFDPSVYREYARKNRMKEYGYNPERLFKETVKDRDLQEIRRLCETGACTDDILRNFEMESVQDMEIYRVLLSNASRDVLTRQLNNCVGMYGYGHRSSSKMWSFVPTNRTEMVSLLLKHGASPDEALKNMAYPAVRDLEWFELMLADATDDVLAELLQKYIKSFGASNPDKDRRAGVSADRFDVIRILLKNGANPNTPNFFGKTALCNAVEYDGDMALVKMLLDNGANASFLYPKTDLLRVFYQGHNNLWGTNRYELTELMLKHGLDANARGIFGRPLLGEIMYFGGFGEGYDLKMAEILLAHGADPNAQLDEDGRMGSITDMAYERRNAKEFLKLLEKHGGKVSDEAKRKKTEKAKWRESDSDARQNCFDSESRVPDRVLGQRKRHGAPDGRMDRVREEMDRFREQMRSCEDPEQRCKLVEEHSKRMRQIHED